MELMKRCRVLLLAGCLALTGAIPALADYTSWQDPQYDFRKVKTVYMANLDMSGQRKTENGQTGAGAGDPAPGTAAR